MLLFKYSHVLCFLADDEMGEDEEQLSDQEYGYVISFLIMPGCRFLIQLHISVRIRLFERVVFSLSFAPISRFTF